MYHSFLIHSSADGHLGCFHVPAIINSAVMNIGVHVSLSVLFWFPWCVCSGICEFKRKVHSIILLPAAAAAKLLQLCLTLCNPTDGSPPGSPVPGILQARTLEWVVIFFSNEGKWKVKVKSLSCVWLLATPWTAAYQAPPSMGFSRQEYWRFSCLGLCKMKFNRSLLFCSFGATFDTML